MKSVRRFRNEGQQRCFESLGKATNGVKTCSSKSLSCFWLRVGAGRVESIENCYSSQGPGLDLSFYCFSKDFRPTGRLRRRWGTSSVFLAKSKRHLGASQVKVICASYPLRENRS